MRDVYNLKAMLCLNLFSLHVYAAPAIEFDFDDAPDTDRVLTSAAKWGMALNVNAESRRNYDLDSAVKDRLAYLEPEFRVALSYAPPGAGWQGFVEMEVAGKHVISDQAGGEENNSDLRLRQGYLLVPDMGHGFALQLGRQSFKDARSWWYDEKMDAVRVYWRQDRVGLEVAYARERALPEDLLDPQTREKNDYTIMAAHYALTRKATLSAIVVDRNDRESAKNEDPTLFGLQLDGEVGKDFRYWGNAARVSGQAKGKKLRGYGGDIGMAWRLDAPFKPYFGLGAAWGSGDTQGGDPTDRHFRQTDVHENKGKLFGLTRYNYYGEVFDPELTNMRILTLVVGCMPTPNLSLDLVYHDYRQNALDDDLFDSDVDMDPDGDHRALGREIDLVAGYRFNANTRMKLVLGAFRPGRAFPGANSAFLLKLEMGWRF